MKGIVFRIAQQIIEDEFSRSTWNELIDAAGVDGSYTALGDYPHEELIAILEAASEETGREVPEILRWIGQNAIPIFSDKYPDLFEDFEESRDLILRLNDIIHPEVQKLYPDAEVPEFDYRTVEDDLIEMSYSSERQLCNLGEGLILGTADYFNESVDVSQTACMNNGDSECLYRIEYK
jgi:predicted hydrocarbon binding protein